MNTKNTFVWLILAAVLFTSIVLLDRYVRPPTVAIQNVLPGLQPATITSVQVNPAGALEIRAERVNHTWLLAKPLAYPAQSAAIEALLATLKNLAPATRISALELHQHRATVADYGFDSPQISLSLEADNQRWQLLIGNKTAPGDQVFVRVVGVAGAFVTDAGWLGLIPRSANDWRSTALVAADVNTCDTIVLTNNAKVIELRCDAANHLWRMVRPLVARANNDRIIEALQSLQAATVSQFVTEDVKTDLSVFGLQPPDLSLWFGQGTNVVSALNTGKSPTNDVTQVFARRERWSVVVQTAREPLALWHGTVNDFRDPHLLQITAPVDEIEVHGRDNFTLRRQGTNDWSIVGEKFPADSESVGQFLKVLAGLRISDYVKDVVTAPDLPAYGLDSPQREITLRTAAGDSNAVIAQLAFATRTNGVFVYRAGEGSIYAITPEDYNRLPESGWEFRDRHIWNFNENDVAQITLHQSGKTRTLIHDGPNKWSLAAGSEGIINPPALEETVHRLSTLTVTGWVARNVTEPEKFGLSQDNWEITVELKSGEKYSVAFGTELSSAHTALAAVTLDGERWAFVFPPVVYQFVSSYLTIPTNER